MARPAIIFFDWRYSPFCLKVRAILDYKRLDYRAVNALTHVRELKRRGGTGKVPAIDIDGELIADSTDIAHALEKRFPNPPLLPATERERGLCHALEEWADESLYFVGLYYRWYEREGRKPIAGIFRQASPLLGPIAYPFYLRRILNQIRGQGTLRKSPDHVRRDLERNLDAVERLIDPGPYLLGDKPYLCDFALWGQLTYLNRTPVGGDAIRARTGIGAFLKRLEVPS